MLGKTHRRGFDKSHYRLLYQNTLQSNSLTLTDLQRMDLLRFTYQVPFYCK